MADLFGSRRIKQPIWFDVVWMIPAQTKLSGFGSIPSSTDSPAPISFNTAQWLDVQYNYLLSTSSSVHKASLLASRV